VRARHPANTSKANRQHLRSLRTEQDFPYVAVARTAAMPPLGPDDRAAISVGLGGDEPDRATGWTAAVDLPRFAPGFDIVACRCHSGRRRWAPSVRMVGRR
jgi:hypothetical protein